MTQLKNREGEISVRDMQIRNEDKQHRKKIIPSGVNSYRDQKAKAFYDKTNFRII